MKKRDYCLVAALLGLAGILAFCFSFSRRESGNLLEITVNGKRYGTYDLSIDQTIPVRQKDGFNQIVIENGKAYMKEADCPDGYCRKQGAISRVNESIICLPHKLTAVIRQTEKQDSNHPVPDVIVQ